MNVLFFVSSLDSGGLENYLLRFLTEKHKRFTKVYVWCKSGKDGQLDDSYTALTAVELIKEKLGYLDITSYKQLQKFLEIKKSMLYVTFRGILQEG